jgi:hypothetical protein
MEFKGVVTHVIDKSGISKAGKPFVSFQIRVEQPYAQYPESVLIETNKKEVLPAIGESVNVFFNMRCNEYNGNLYGRNNLWKVEKLGNATQGQEPDDDEDPLKALDNPEPLSMEAPPDSNVAKAAEELKDGLDKATLSDDDMPC